MNYSSIIRLLAILVLAGSFTACQNSKMATETTTESDTENVSENDSAESYEEMEELYWQRQQEALMNFSQDDVKFMTGMIAHHAQALIMSDLAPKNNASPAVQRLAARIINAQKDEIKSMQRWLRDRNQPVPEVHIEGLQLMIHGLGEDHMKMDHTNMAGMLSPSQLKELSEAKGKEFDRLFLKYMIDHHQGAVTMVTELFNSDGAVQDEAAFKLASDIQVDQRTEIDRMQLMLDEITAAK
ncbi:MAG: DUF305 domain-containing protein [Gracilimonas sp.]|jgi:uncharacterized protein (DUF305 family)|nr:DUF305 domain-containing protein [Gracilimonas sp.]